MPTPTPSEVLATYPGVTRAVAWVELMLCTPIEGESAWDILMAARPPMSPSEVLAYLKDAIDDDKMGRAAEAKAEMDRPEFLLYLRAKMGAM